MQMPIPHAFEPRSPVLKAHDPRSLMARTRGTVSRKAPFAGRGQSKSPQETCIASATPTSLNVTVANASPTSYRKPNPRELASTVSETTKSRTNGDATPPTFAHSLAQFAPIVSPCAPKPARLGSIVCAPAKSKTNVDQAYINAEDEYAAEESNFEGEQDAQDKKDEKDNSASEDGDSDDDNAGTLEDALNALNSLAVKDMEALNKRILQQWRTVTRRYHKREMNRNKHPKRAQSQALNGPYAVPLVHWLLLSRDPPVTPKCLQQVMYQLFNPVLTKQTDAIQLQIHTIAQKLNAAWNEELKARRHPLELRHEITPHHLYMIFGRKILHSERSLQRLNKVPFILATKPFRACGPTQEHQVQALHEGNHATGILQFRDWYSAMVEARAARQRIDVAVAWKEHINTEGCFETRDSLWINDAPTYEKNMTKGRPAKRASRQITTPDLNDGDVENQVLDKAATLETPGSRAKSQTIQKAQPVKPPESSGEDDEDETEENGMDVQEEEEEGCYFAKDEEFNHEQEAQDEQTEAARKQTLNKPSNAEEAFPRPKHEPKAGLKLQSSRMVSSSQSVLPAEAKNTVQQSRLPSLTKTRPPLAIDSSTAGYDNNQTGLAPPVSDYNAASPKLYHHQLPPPSSLPFRPQDTDKPINSLPVAKGQEYKTDIDAERGMPHTGKAAALLTPSPEFAAVRLPSASSQEQSQRPKFHTSPGPHISISMSQKRGSTLPSEIESPTKKRCLHDRMAPSAATSPQKPPALKAANTPPPTPKGASGSEAITIDQDSSTTETCSSHSVDIQAWTQTHFGEEAVQQLSSEGDRGIIGDVLVNNMLAFGVSFCAGAETYPCGGPFLRPPLSVAGADQLATEGPAAQRADSEHLIRTDPKLFPETERMILIVHMPGGVGHWVLVEVQHIVRKIIVRDSLSMYTANSPKLRTVITKYIEACLWDNDGKAGDWIWETLSCPQQDNEIDCGVFAITMALHLCADHEIPDSMNAFVWRRVLLALTLAKPLLSCLGLPDKDVDMTDGVSQGQEVANSGDEGGGIAHVVATIQRLTESLKRDFVQQKCLAKQASRRLDEVMAAVSVLEGLNNKVSNEQNRLDEAITRLSKEELDIRATCDAMKTWHTADDQDILAWTGRIEEHIHRVKQARHRHRARRDTLQRASEMISRLEMGQASWAFQNVRRKARERVDRVRLELACSLDRVVQDLGLKPEMETVKRGEHAEILKRMDG